MIYLIRVTPIIMVLFPWLIDGWLKQIEQKESGWHEQASAAYLCR